MRKASAIVWGKCLALILIMAATITGCTSEAKSGLTLMGEPVNTPIISKDGTVQVTVPKFWRQDENEYLNGSARLVVHGNRTPIELSIIQELQAEANEGINLEVWEKELDKEYDSVVVQDVQAVEIDGVPAKERYIMRVDDNMSDYAMQAFLEKEGAFYLIEISGVGAAHYPREELRKLMSTFQVLKPAEKEQFVQSQSQTIVSENKSLQITVPLNWGEMESQYDQIAELILRDDRTTQLMVTRVFESEIEQEKLTEKIVNERFNSLQLVGHSEKLGWRNLTIDGQPAYQLEGKSELEGTKRGVIITGLKKGNAYYFLTITCPLKDFSLYKREYKRIMDSFKVLKQVEKPKPSLLNNENSKVFESIPPNMRIELTEKWKELSLFHDGQIQMLHEGGDNTMFMAIGEDAAGLASVTLEEAYELYIDSSVLQNSSWSKPEPIKIRNYDAIYFKGTGISNGRKAMVIMAITRTSRQCTQLIFVGEQEFMKANEDWFKKALTTYKEGL